MSCSTSSIAQYLSPADQKTLLHAVSDHADLEPPPAIPSAEVCWHPERKDFPVYDLGFDLNASKPDHTMTAVTADGPAYAVGLRNGQKLKNWSVYSDPDHMAKITVDIDGATKVITYYPRGKAVPVWQYAAVPGATCSADAPAAK